MVKRLAMLRCLLRGMQSIAITSMPDGGYVRYPSPRHVVGLLSGLLNPGCEAHKQYFQPMVPQTGPYDAQVNTGAASALFNKIGPRIFITHSQSVGLGWRLDFLPTATMSPFASCFGDFGLFRNNHKRLRQA